MSNKVWALLGQWVRRFALTPSGCVLFMSFWFTSAFDVSPAEVFSDPFAFTPSLLIAWQGLDGSFSVSRCSLVFGSLCPHFCSPVSGMTTKSCYLYLLFANVVQPHCVIKFAPTYGRLHWPTTWRLLDFFDLDCQVVGLNWKIGHGVLYMAQRLVSFVLSVPLDCFCGAPIKSLEHLFFSCPLVQSVLSWFQSLMFNSSPMCPVIFCRHVLFGFSCDELRATPRIFVYILNLCKFTIWQSRNDYRFRGIPLDTVTAIIKVRTSTEL